MKIYRNIKSAPKKRRAIAVGIFDGVHLGHRAILKTLLHEAQTAALVPMVLTFDPDPVKVLFPDKPHPILISLEHRLALLEQMGVKEVLVMRFDKKLAGLYPDEFLTRHLIGSLGMEKLVVGHDFRFGRGGYGSIPFLNEASRQLGFKLTVVGPFSYAGQPISSTRIRAMVQKGELVNAEKMLGRPVCVRGTVIKGSGRGKKLGFPTANIDPHHETLPPAGVYAVRGRLGKTKLKGVLHLGPRPTFKDDPSVEAHFFNFKRNIYGKELELEFLLKIREIRQFKGKDELISAIRADIAQAQRILKKL